MTASELATQAFLALCENDPDPQRCDELAELAARAYRAENGLDPDDRYGHLK